MTRTGRLRSPSGRRTVLRMGGGPYTSWPRSLRLPSASGNNVFRPPRAVKGARTTILHSPGKTSRGVGRTRYACTSNPMLGRRSGEEGAVEEPRRGGTKKTRREPLEEPSAPVQAPLQTGRRASHLGGLALCVSTSASAAKLSGAGFATQGPRGPDSRNLRRNLGRTLGQQDARDDERRRDYGADRQRLVE